MKICRLHLQLKWRNIPDVLRRTALSISPHYNCIRQTDNTFIQFYRLVYISTYSHTYLIQTIDTVQVDVSNTKRLDSSLTIVILLAFVSFPVSFNVFASIFFHIFMLI